MKNFIKSNLQKFIVIILTAFIVGNITRLFIFDEFSGYSEKQSVSASTTIIDTDEINTLIGSTTISNIGDGTITGSISSLNTDIDNLNDNYDWTFTDNWDSELDERWAYRKLGTSGYYEMYGQISYTADITSSYGSLYFTTITVNLPFELSSGSIHYCDCNVYAPKGGLIMANMYSYGKTSVKFYVKNSKSESKYFVLNIHMIAK